MESSRTIPISLVTVHLDDLAGLRRTMDSITSRSDLDAFEWVVIDGGSRPDSAEEQDILRRVTRTASVYLSEPDHGLYDAMNKGTARAGGEYLVYLNAGDELHPQFDCARLRAALGERRPAMIWGQGFDRQPGGAAYPRRTRAPRWLRYGTALAHQAILFRRDRLGATPYDLDYAIAADYDLVCRLYRAGADILRLPLPVCVFELGGRSAADPEATLAEEAAVRRRAFGLPGPLDRLITAVKGAAWALTRRLPGLRRVLRRRI